MKKIVLILWSSIILCSDETSAELIGTWKCGENCTATLDDTGDFLVSGTGETYSYSHDNQPWNGYLSEIKSVKVEGLSVINSNLTYYSPITNLELDDSVKYLYGGFEGNHVALLELPDSVTTIDNYALYSPYAQEIIIPDTITNLGTNGFGRNFYETIQNKNTKIICRGNNCASVKKLFENYSYHGKDGSSNISDASGNFFFANSSNCDSQNYYWSGSSCKSKKNGISCDKNFKKIEDFCNRIQYTPAEAAKVLKNDNTNEVTITFKK